jgi:transcriptional regulator with XRE-family HTH domain
MERLGRAVRHKRKMAGQTQLELAEKLNISKHYVGEIEKGKGKPSFPLMCQLAETLKLYTDGIFHSKLSKFREDVEELIVYLYECDEAEINVIFAMMHTMEKNKHLPPPDDTESD